MKFIFHLLAILYVSASALFTNVKVFNGAYGATVIDGGIWNRIEKEHPENYRAAMKGNPTGRMATPRDVANAVAFLSSPRASYISGINMIVGGAMTARVNY